MTQQEFLLETAEECMAELDHLKIPYHRPTSWQINRRAKKRWGQCRRFPDQHYEINISDRLLESIKQKQALKTTVMHELLHTCYGCMNHGTRWKTYAEKVNRAYGYEIKTTDTPLDMGFTKEQLEAYAEPYKHRFVCNDCGSVVLRQRESRFTRHYQFYRCAKCGGTFRREY